jgi:L-alanine-DL-glutamate epimerase-like enolase superfamily enzyme
MMYSPKPQKVGSLFSRRDLFRWGALAGACAVLPKFSPPIFANQLSSKWLTIESIERVTLEVPFREIPARAMAKEVPHWVYSEVVQVKLKSGKVGIGETMLFYTWGTTSDEIVASSIGKNAADLMWSDELGAGLQIALFDAVARTFEVPVHALLGSKVNDQTPLSWWNIDTSPDDMATECKLAYEQGYLAYKTKGRPWIDLWEQMEKSSKVVPENFKIDMDFNDTLLDAEKAIGILKQFEHYPQVDIWETPIPQSDILGNKKITSEMKAKVAMHYGTPPPLDVFREQACDGFVLGGSARTLLDANAACQLAQLPFWLQLTGTGITAAWSLHFGGVLSQAQWPAVNCHQLYKHNLLTESIVVQQGKAVVPDRPGLGYELDPEVLTKFRVAKPSTRPDPPRLIETTWPDGRRMYLGSHGVLNFILVQANLGNIPFFERGVTTRFVPDDGTAKWRDLYNRAGPEKPLFV